MTGDMHPNMRASRRRVARSRGALSGLVVLILGIWAAIVPFIGPYFDLAYTPRPNDTWHWTAARGWLEVLPGAAAVLGGLLLLASASRLMTLLGAWLAALAGAWLVIGPPLSTAINLDAGTPDPSRGTNTQALIALLFFYAVGAAILFFGSLALGRLSVLSVRDVRAAERRAEAEEAERQAALEAAASRERERQRAGTDGIRDDGVWQESPRDDGVRNDDSGRHAQEPVGTSNGAPTNGRPNGVPGNGGAPGQYGPGQYGPGQYGSAQQPTPQHPATQHPAGYPPAPPPPREG